MPLRRPESNTTLGENMSPQFTFLDNLPSLTAGNGISFRNYQSPFIFPVTASVSVWDLGLQPDEDHDAPGSGVE